MIPEDDIEDDASPTEHWDVAATHALADLLRAAHQLRPDSRLHFAAICAAEALAGAIERYHAPDHGTPH